MTKIINFFGSPSAGKSRNASLLFSLLKDKGVKTELIPEFAKEIVYRGDHKTLEQYQPLIFGEQLHRINRCKDSVDFVIVDSPLLLSAVYGKKMKPSFIQCVKDIFHEFDNINYFLKLDPEKYHNYGRTQTVSESLALEKDILELLTKAGVCAIMVKNAHEVLRHLELDHLKFYGKICEFVTECGATCDKKVTEEICGLLCCKEHADIRGRSMGYGY
jgi:glycerol-3-phosphate cytidylyltransferase-like family protein